MQKDKKTLAEAKLVSDFYKSRNEEGRQRMMEMLVALNTKHFAADPKAIAISQPAAGKVSRPAIVEPSGLTIQQPAKGRAARQFMPIYMENVDTPLANAEIQQANMGSKYRVANAAYLVEINRRR